MHTYIHIHVSGHNTDNKNNDSLGGDTFQAIALFVQNVIYVSLRVRFSCRHLHHQVQDLLLSNRYDCTIC